MEDDKLASRCKGENEQRLAPPISGCLQESSEVVTCYIRRSSLAALDLRYELGVLQWVNYEYVEVLLVRLCAGHDEP